METIYLFLSAVGIFFMKSPVYNLLKSIMHVFVLKYFKERDKLFSVCSVCFFHYKFLENSIELKYHFNIIEKSSGYTLL